MDGRIEMILDSGSCDIGLESTIIDFTSTVPMMLRPGYVNERMLKDVLGEIEKDPAVFTEVNGLRPKAPGMKYRHYAPKGSLAVVSGDTESVIAYIRDRIDKKTGDARIAVLSSTHNTDRYPGADLVLDTGDIENEIQIASRLYDNLRRCDDENIDEIYSEEFNTPVLGQAIMNRLIKAAGHNIINVQTGDN